MDNSVGYQKIFIFAQILAFFKIKHMMFIENKKENNMKNNNCFLPINLCHSRCANKTPNQTIIRLTGPTGPAGPVGPTGATGPTGPTGGGATLDASINRNDTTQTVVENNVVSITGTNVLTNLDSDLFFVNNMVRINSSGVYLITATIEMTGTEGSYEFAINVGGKDYKSIAIVNNDSNSGTVSHTIYLNISTTPTDVSIYNRNNSSTTISKAELDVVRLV